MAYDSLLWGLLMIGCSIQALTATSEEDPLEYMSKEERDALRDEARDMFYHAYNAYMDNAYPADELMPLSCKGRYRGSEPNRGDIDSTLGNFSLTLVDTLDTLVVLGDFEEFENAIKLVTRGVSFDTDVIVSLFETNIRMLGGLLSGHILAEYLQQRADIMPWYKGELLDLAKDLGYRFLPAFNTTTGIPYGRINLKYGMKGVPMEVSRETCTACAGSMILEMAALSRLTGESIFEEKAQKAMDVLWRMRHRGTDLMGSVLNVHSGDWVRRDSGVGAGIDSYYEYCLKAYILLGDEKYLGRFNKHYQAVMKYVSQGPMLLDVHMHRPNTNSKNFMDALLAFWPGLQVLKGDIKPAVETHEMLYQVMQRHNFIPEAFTTDFQVHWGHHPLRPEFLESTYFLYRATGDHYYLGVGRKVLKSLQTYARVPCGYAAVSDVRTNKHDDTMDSFVLSETFKYLFLLFAEPTELVLDLDEFIFTTEGHLLPLTLASIRTNVSSDFERDVVHVDEFDRTCPNSLHLFPASVRQPLRNMVEDVCPRRSVKRRLNASQFQANNIDHLKMLSDMGITTLTLADGRVQLLHTFSNAKTPQDSEEGLLFMQEMVELSRMQAQQTETKPRAVTFIKPRSQMPQMVTLLAGPAHFGPDLQGFNKVFGEVVLVNPPAACSELVNADRLTGKIAIMARGKCMFIEKARRIQKAGAVAGIVLDNVAGSSAATSPMFAMSGDGKEIDDVTIPVVFLFSTEATELMRAISLNPELTVNIGGFVTKEEIQLKAPTDLSMFERLKGSLKSFLSRQMTPQSTASGGQTDVTSPYPEQQEERVDKIDFYHLRAEIAKDSLGGAVTITATPHAKPAHITQLPKEEEWHQLKEVMLNEVYANTKQQAGLQIRAFVITNYHDCVTKARGVTNADLLDSISLQDKVLWFLKELSMVSPNPSILRMGQLSDYNKKRLLQQNVLSKMDVVVLNLNAIAEKWKEMKTVRPNMEHLLKISESGMQLVENYSVLRHLVQHLFDGEEQVVMQHLALLDHVHLVVHDTYQEIAMDGLQKYLVKSGESESPYYDILIDNLQKNLNEERHLIAEMKGENLPIAESVLPKKSKDTGNEKLKDFKYFILTEIENAVKNTQQDMLQKGEKVDDGTKDSDAENHEAKHTTEPSKTVVSSPQNQSTTKNAEGTAEKSMRSETDSQNTIQSKGVQLQAISEHNLVDYLKNIKDTLNALEYMKQMRNKFKLEQDKRLLLDDANWYEIPEMSIVEGVSRIEVETHNKKQILFQKIQKEISKMRARQNSDSNVKPPKQKVSDAKILPTDSLEDFKSPIWATDEGKLKHSDAEYDSMEENDLEYREEYVARLKNNKDDTKMNEHKHIDGEL